MQYEKREETDDYTEDDRATIAAIRVYLANRSAIRRKPGDALCDGNEGSGGHGAADRSNLP
jgi:hypothetical protein